MANQKFTDLPVADPLDGSEIAAVVQGADSVQTTLQDIVNLLAPGLADNFGYLNIPQNSKSANYTTVFDDAGKHIYHPLGAGAGDTFAIASNATVPYPIGTAITFVNRDTNSITIAINVDVLFLSNTGATGSRTLSSFGVATALKITATEWLISGTGLT